MSAQLRTSLTTSTTLTNPNPPQLRAIVLDYLCHNCYTNTARVFSRDSAVKNVDADGDEIMSMSSCGEDDFVLSEEMLRQIEIRKEIRHKILCGHVEEAVELLNLHFPTVLVEFDDLAPLHLPVPPNKVRFVANTSVDPSHLSLNLRILAFIEACRTTPLEYKPPSVNGSYAAMEEDPSSHTTPSTSDTKNTITNEDHLNNLLARIRKLYASAGALSKPRDRETYIEELGQVGGLLAYKIPEDSPMAKYLSQARREAVADQINSAVLYRTGLAAISRLELHTRYTTTLWSWMHDMRYELPPPRKWPLGLEPPSFGGRSMDASLKTPLKESREIVPAFDLHEFLNMKPL